MHRNCKEGGYFEVFIKDNTERNDVCWIDQGDGSPYTLTIRRIRNNVIRAPAVSSIFFRSLMILPSENPSNITDVQGRIAYRKARVCVALTGTINKPWKRIRISEPGTSVPKLMVVSRS